MPAMARTAAPRSMEKMILGVRFRVAPHQTENIDFAMSISGGGDKRDCDGSGATEQQDRLEVHGSILSSMRNRQR